MSVSPIEVLGDAGGAPRHGTISDPVARNVGTWNLNNRKGAAVSSLGSFAKTQRLDLLMIQEVSAGSLETFAEAAGLDWAVSAHDAGAPLMGGGRTRASAIAGRGVPPHSVGLIPGAPLAERSLFARLDDGVTVVSYHAPPGVTWGEVKVEQALALLAWLSSQPGPVVMGADANTPMVDHPDPAHVRTHWMSGSRKLRGGVGDDVVFGGHPRHQLRDAYRLWLRRHPLVLQATRDARPEGPLAVSHVTGKRKDGAGTPRRFDTLWISSHFDVADVDYAYEGAVAAGTDHALVTARLVTVDADDNP